jgi:stearoyl-CoA desaturase (delta-9 desaturase)
MTAAQPGSPVPASTGTGQKPVLTGQRGNGEVWLVKMFVVVPLLALILAVPLAWGRGLSRTDLVLALGFYAVSGLGVTVGFHRYFTHRAFKAGRRLRIALAIAGSLALQGPVIVWVADHRRHHAFSDRPGDPHSPWRFGTSAAALARGFWYAHIGWLFAAERTNAQRFAPDLLGDAGLRRVNDSFMLIAAVSLVAPGVLDGLLTWSWSGLVSGLFWGGLVRVAALHHVTWSVNSICHLAGTRAFATRNRSANVWPLAIASFGESWHNLHHADPTCARHGVLRGQLDISARLIWVLEKIGWAWDVRWPAPARQAHLIQSH